jgi:GNAT superfamily N-acetyltransferase
MPGYFGTALQQRLQAEAEANAALIEATPGACQNGRMVGCDDPDRLGWSAIERALERDGVVGFRLIPRAMVAGLESRLAEAKARLDLWDVFLGDRETTLPACRRIVAEGLPPGLDEVDPPTDGEHPAVGRMQALMGACGIVPFSGSMLAGAIAPAKTVAIAGAGDLVAVAHSYRPHNRHSPYHAFAWGGLVAVARSHRGRGLGTAINARMVVGAFETLGASHIYELVAPDNAPSRRMVEACGLRLDPDLVCGAATAQTGLRFTR